MDIEKAKELLEEYRDDELFGVAGREALGVVLSKLEKQEAIINEMAKTINKEYYKDIIENYTKKVEGK